MPGVLFVALQEMLCLEWLVGWVQSRPGQVTVTQADHLSDCGETLAQAPALVIAPSAEREGLESFISTCLAHPQDLAITAIFVHLRTPDYGLHIHEWDPQGRLFKQRRCSLAHLQREIDAVLQRHQLPAEVASRVRGIGFYDCITVDGHPVHVQTEVAGRTEPCIRTTVHRDGAILSATTLAWPAGLHDPGAAETLVRSKHQQVVDRIRNGQQS